MNKERLWGACVALSLWAAGCTTATPREQLIKRAAFDLNCDKEDIRVIKIDQRTRGVRGCGKQATYVNSCERTAGPFENCTWIMNTRGGGGDDE